MASTETKRFNNYVFENVVDGILLIGRTGEIQYINESAQNLIDITDGELKEAFVRSQIEREEKINDAFYQIIIDAIYEKTKSINKKVSFLKNSGERLELNVKSSYWSNSKNEDENGILLIIQNITEEEAAKREKNKLIVVFSLFLSIIGVWNLFFAAMNQFSIDLPSYIMTYILLGIGFVMAVVLCRYTGFKISDIGLSIKGHKGALLFGVGVSAGAIIVMVVLKLVLISLDLGYFAEEDPFWDFSFTSGMKVYPISVVLQEFISQGIIHECLMRIISGKHSKALAIFLSSMLFMILHIHKGVLFMIGAALLVCIVGVIYRKQRTIWGVTIIHYSITIAACFLGWL